MTANGKEGTFPAEDAHLRRAQQYIRDGRISAACAEYLRYADRCAARGDLMDAVKYYYRVEEYRRLDIKARRRLAELLAAVGNTSRSVATFLNVAEEFVSQGLMEDAVDTLRDAVKLMPDRLALRYRLAELYDQAGQTQKAVNIYLQVLETYPREAEAWAALGALYARRNSRDEAVDAYLHAVKTYEKEGNLLGAAGVYERVAELMDEKSAPLKKLVEIYGKLGFKNEMTARMLELARIAEERGEKERALAIYSKVIDIDPANEVAQNRLGKSIHIVSVLPNGEALVRGEEPEEELPPEPEETPPGGTAFPPERKIRTVDDLLGFKADAGDGEPSESPQVYYDLGLAYLEMGITEEAVHYLQLASHAAELRVRACNMLGLCFLEKGMPDVAVKEFERALATPGIPESEAVGLYYNLATAYERLGEYRRALDQLRHVYAIDVNYLDVREKLRRLRAREGG